MIRKLSLLISFCIISLFANAQTAISDPSSYLDAIRKANQDVHSIKCQYTLVHHVPLLESDQRQKGTFYYSDKAEGIALIDASANSKTVFSRTQFLSVENGQKIQLSADRSPAIAQMLSLISSCLTGNFDVLSGRGNLVYDLTGEQEFRVTFVPTDRRMAKHFTRIVMTFSHANMTLSSLSLVSKNNESHTYSFASRTINIPIPPRIFE